MVGINEYKSQLKKLLYITTFIQDSGGVARVLSVKLNYLIEKFNYDIHVIETNHVEGRFFYDFNSKIKFNYIHSNQLFTYKKALNSLVYSICPDIIINCDNGLKGALLPYLLNRKTPLIYERHCSKNISSPYLIERLKLKLSNFLLEKNSSNYKYFVLLNEEEKKQWKGDNIKIMPNPLWYSVSKNSNNGSSKIAIAVGRHAHEKGYDKLIQVWKAVVQEYPDWILKIYGEKNKDIPLEQVVKEQCLENNIRFFDPINNVGNIYSEASFLLSTSRSESFGLVLIEAMSFSIPVIAFSGTSGAKSIIKNGENGFLVKNDDIKSYVEKIKRLIENNGLRFKMGENAKEYVKKYDLEAIMNQWHNLFNSK